MSLISQQILKDVESLPTQLQTEALDFIQLLKQKVNKNKKITPDKDANGKEIAEIMSRIAERNHAFSDIEDPVEWQRKIRQDRPLPGRK